MRDDIKKRREKYNITSRASQIFGGENKEMITERLPGMTFKEYSFMRKIQNKTIKKLFPKSPDRDISRLMIPTIPSLHLQYQVAFRRALKEGLIEEVKPIEKEASNFFVKIFNFIRSIFGQNAQVYAFI